MEKIVDEGEFSFKEISESIKVALKYLKTKLLLLVILSIIGIVGGVVFAIYSPITYKSKLSFVVEEGKMVGGSLASLAGQFGIDVGSTANGVSIISGDNIILFLKSKSLTKEILLSSYDSSKYSLADKYADIYGLRKKWKKSSEVGKEIFFPVNSTTKFSIKQDSLLHIIIEKIIKKQLLVERPEKKASFITVEASFRDERLNILYAKRLVDRAIEIYIMSKTKRQKTNVDRLQRRSDSIATILNGKTFQSALNQQELLDLNPAERVQTVKAEVSTRDKIILTTLYGEVVKNLEIAKVQLSQETPTIQMVDLPEMPLENNRKNKLLFGVIFGVLVLGLASGVLVLFKKRD